MLLKNGSLENRAARLWTVWIILVALMVAPVVAAVSLVPRAVAEEKPAIGQSAAAKPTDEQYRFARLVTAFELTNTHFAADRILLASPEGVEKLRENATKVSRYLADQMLTEVKVGAEWEVSIIRPADQNRKSLTEFEKQAVEKIRQGPRGRRTDSIGNSLLRSAISYAREVC